MEPVEVISPANMLATLAIFGTFTVKIVDGIRGQLPGLGGLKVNALAWAIGAVLSFSFDLQGAEAILEVVGASAAREPHLIVDYLLTGAVIASGAGVIADLTDRKVEPLIVEVDADGHRL